MKRTSITAILIAITANSASAQQAVSVPYQAGQSWPAASQAYQPQIQYPVQQSYPQSSSTVPYTTQGQYYTVPQTVVQPAVPAATTPAATTLPAATTRVLPQSVGQQNQLQQSAAVSRAPAPAPSIPPQPEDLIVPAPTSIVAQPVLQQPQPEDLTVPAPTSIVAQPVQQDPQPEDLIVPAPTSIVAQPVQQQPQELAVDQQIVPGTLSAPAPVTSSLVAQPEPVRPVEESVLKTQGNQEEFAVVENKESTLEPVKEAISSPETATAVVENQREEKLAIEGQLVDLTEELVSAVSYTHLTLPTILLV